MRLIQIFVPSDVRSAIDETLANMDVDAIYTDADAHRDGAIGHIPVPTGAVDTVLDRLYDAGLDEGTYTVVSDVHRATVPNVEALTDRYVAGPKGERGASHSEIRERADDLKPDTATYLAFAALSAIVAVGGLLLNSAIIIVGAMVIAPFAGSTLSASVGTVIGDREMVVDSATSQTIGLVVAFLGAVAMSFVIMRSGFVSPTLAVSRIEQVSAFFTPSLLTLAIAIAAGLAGALALATDLPVSVAGVAVAAAIVPAAATAGIGAVWGQPQIVIGAIVLLLMNIVFINLAAYVALLSLGYRSSVIRDVRQGISVSARTGAYALIVLVFVAMVAMTSVATYQHLAFEQAVNQEVQRQLDDPSYRSLELLGVETDYNDMNVIGTEESITVTVSRTSDAEYDRLDDELQMGISDATNRPVTVTVRFIDLQQARPDESVSPPPSLVDRIGSWAEDLAERISRSGGATTVCPSGGPC